jgi:hypothetical protein
MKISSRIWYLITSKLKTITSKALMVGGLIPGDHLLEMVDMALSLREIFDTTIAYDLKLGNTSTKIPIKMSVAFGIQTGAN